MNRAIPSADDILQKVAHAAFGRQLILNVHRGLVAEAIVAAALEPEWRWCSGDYASWDFERDGIRLEVKQSAARQSWATAKPSVCSFDIASRSGRWEDGTRWIEAPGRHAHLYVFAHHPLFDESADHRDAAQWLFHVVATDRLPPGKRIGLNRLRSLTDACRFGGLGDQVSTVARSVMPG